MHCVPWNIQYIILFGILSLEQNEPPMGLPVAPLVLVLVQSYHCPNANETTIKYMGIINRYLTTKT